MSSFRNEIRHTINKWSQENGSNTPDFILVNYLLHCLLAFDDAVNAREQWYDRKPGQREPLKLQEMEWPRPPITRA
jgi:hypothetical protein